MGGLARCYNLATGAEDKQLVKVGCHQLTGEKKGIPETILHTVKRHNNFTPIFLTSLYLTLHTVQYTYVVNSTVYTDHCNKSIHVPAGPMNPGAKYTLLNAIQHCRNCNLTVKNIFNYIIAYKIKQFYFQTYY